MHGGLAAALRHGRLRPRLIGQLILPLGQLQLRFDGIEQIDVGGGRPAKRPGQRVFSLNATFLILQPPFIQPPAQPPDDPQMRDVIDGQLGIGRVLLDPILQRRIARHDLAVIG